MGQRLQFGQSFAFCILSPGEKGHSRHHIQTNVVFIITSGVYECVLTEPKNEGSEDKVVHQTAALACIIRKPSATI